MEVRENIVQAQSVARPIIPEMEASIARLRHQDILTLCVLGLLGMGVIMVQSASTTVNGDLAWQWTVMGEAFKIRDRGGHHIFRGKPVRLFPFRPLPRQLRPFPDRVVHRFCHARVRAGSDPRHRKPD